MGQLNTKAKTIDWAIGVVQHYNPQKYWKMRNYVINSKGGLKALVYLFKIKKMDAYNNASLGTNIGLGASFGSIPSFPHGLNGIIITPYAVVGKNAKIYQQVTIGDDGRIKENAPIIGDNVTLYPGAKIVGKCHIGDGAIICPNAVVSFDVPPNAMVRSPIVEIKER